MIEFGGNGRLKEGFMTFVPMRRIDAVKAGCEA